MIGIQNLKKIILVCVLSLTSIVGFAQSSNIIDQIIWVVGDEAILKSDVEEARMEMLSRGDHLKGDPYCFIPEQLAVQKLYLDQAKIDSIQAPESEFANQVSRIERMYISNVGSKEKLQEYWKMSMSQIHEKLRDQVKNNYLVGKVQEKIVGKIKLTPSEVNRYYSELPKDSLPYIPTSVEVQIITNEPTIPIKEIDRIKQELRRFTKRVKTGETDFSTLAIMYSEDKGSAPNGGELGFMGRAQLDPDFANEAFSLNNTNQVSNIVKTQYGYHIIQLIERRGDRANFRHILLRPEVPQSAMDSSLKKLDSVRTDVLSKKFTFEDATVLSYDNDTRKNNGLMVNKRQGSNMGTSHFTMEELPQEMGKIVNAMKIGDISKPFRMTLDNGNEIAAIVKLKTKVNGHIANVSDDYQILKGIVEEKKKQDILKRWLQNKIKNTYVRIDRDWRNCDFQYKGWVK